MIFSSPPPSFLLTLLLLLTLLTPPAAATKSHCRSNIINRLRKLGFSKYAADLKAYPELLEQISCREDNVIWAVGDEVYPALRARALSWARVAMTTTFIGRASIKLLKRESWPMQPIGAQALITQLDDPALVNLGEGQAQRVVTGFDEGGKWDFAANITVSAGLGQVVEPTDGPFAFDRGVIYSAPELLEIPVTVTATLDVLDRTSKFLKVLRESGKDEYFDETTACTIFVPINAALKDADIEVDEYIFCSDAVYSPYLTPENTYRSKAGRAIKIELDEHGDKLVNGAKILKADNIVKNGVVHTVKDVWRK